MDKVLTADPRRAGMVNATGIFVRAKREDKWDSVDIAELDTDSLTAFLRSRGGENAWAENLVRILLGYDQVLMEKD